MTGAGVAFASNAIADDHRRYLALGGKGFILGDGALNYSREQIPGELLHGACVEGAVRIAGRPVW